MTVRNDFLPFASNAGANVLAQADYAALAARTAGFSAGILQSAAFNKMVRQQSIIATAVAQMIADQTGQDVIDDGTTATIEANLIAAIKTLARATVDYYQDTGSTANAYVITASPLTSGQPVSLRFRTTRANTGACTISFGEGVFPLRTEQGNDLAAGDIASNAVTSFVYDPALSYCVVTETVLSQLGTLAHENIGQGLEDDGAGSARVKLADTSIRRSASGVQTNDPVTVVSANQSVTSANHGSTLLVTGAAVTVTAPATSTLWNGYNVTLVAKGGPVAFAVNAADKVNGGAAGAGYTVLQNQSVNLVCDGAGNWYSLFQTGITIGGSFTPLYVTTSQTLGAGTYEVDTTAGPVSITLPAGIAAGATLEFSDPFGTWGTNPLTLLRNGNTILGLASDLIWDVAGESFRIIYNGADWKIQ